jgi:hypothetical protein
MHRCEFSLMELGAKNSGCPDSRRDFGGVRNKSPYRLLSWHESLVFGARKPDPPDCHRFEALCRSVCSRCAHSWRRAAGRALHHLRSAPHRDEYESGAELRFSGSGARHWSDPGSTSLHCLMRGLANRIAIAVDNMTVLQVDGSILPTDIYRAAFGYRNHGRDGPAPHRCVRYEKAAG